MRNNNLKINRSLDNKIRNACERIPQRKRKYVALMLCFSFVVLFSFMIWDSFQSEGVKKMMKIEHITPLDLPQDSLIQKLKEFTNGK